VTARRESPPARPLSRRRFVALVAGSAAALASPAAAAPASRKPAAARSAKPLPPAAPPAPAASALEKELVRQRKSTLAALKILREYPLPPGGDLPVVFRPLRAERRGR